MLSKLDSNGAKVQTFVYLVDLENAKNVFFAKLGFDTAEIGPLKVCKINLIKPKVRKKVEINLGEDCAEDV